MSFVSIGPVSFLISSALLLLILLSCYGTGGSALKIVGIRRNVLTSSEQTLISTAVGLILLALCVFFLGLAGFLNRRFFLGMTAVGLFLAYGRRAEFKMDLKIKESGKVGVAVIVLAAFLLSFLRCGNPPTGNDALAYHLADVKEFILGGHIAPILFSRESLWPYQTEMHFLLGLLLQGTTLAQMMHWIYYPLTAGLIFCFGERFFGKKEAVWASLIWIFTPVAFQQSSEAYVDLALPFFVFLSFYSVILKEVIGAKGAALLSGVFCGAALATKYLAFMPAGILALFWLFQGRKHRFQHAVIFLASLLLVSGVWYLRSYLILGNPVYPFLPDFFGGRGFHFGITQTLGMGQGLADFFLLLWNVTLYPNAFGGNWIGPLYLLLVPTAFLYTARFKKPLWVVCVFALMYSFAVFKTVAQARFFLPVLPFFSILSGFALGRILEGPKLPARIAAAIFSGVILFHTAIFVYRSRETWKPVLGIETAESFLLKNERSFAGYRYLNQTGEGSKIFNAIEPRRFYSESRRLVMDGPPLRNFLAGRNQLLKDFLAREKFDYIWVSPLVDSAVLKFIAENRYRQAYSYRFEEGGVPFDYQIYSKANLK